MTRGITILSEVAIVLSQCTRLTDAYIDQRTDRPTDAYRNTKPRLHSCSAVKIDWHYTQNYENPHTGSYSQAPVHRPNVSFIHKQSIHGIRPTVTILVITHLYLSSQQIQL